MAIHALTWRQAYNIDMQPGKIRYAHTWSEQTIKEVQKELYYKIYCKTFL